MNPILVAPACETPLDHVESAQSSIFELRAGMDQLVEAIAQQKSAMVRLERAFVGGRAEEQTRALREAMMYLMVFQTVGAQIGTTFEQFAEPLVSALHDLKDQLKEREQLAALSASADALNSSLELSEVLHQAMDMLAKLTGAERTLLMLAAKESGEMKIEISRNLDEQEVQGSAFAVSRTIVETVVKEGSTIVTTNAAADPRFSAQESIAVHSLRSIICAPLKTKDRVFGVIYADHRINPAQFSQADADFVTAFANQASTAIENARLFESVSVARNLMQNVFESITSGVITTNMNGTITLFNRAAEGILNMESEECLDLPTSLVLPALGGVIPDLVDQVVQRRQVVVASDVENDIEGRGRVCVNLTAAPLIDAGGAPQGVAVVLEDRTESVRYEQQRTLVKRYLPAELVDSLADLSELQLGGARQVVSIFFADIRGFTSYSEEHDPTEVVEIINTYFGIANEAVRRNHGIVDKYMGDAIMAHFNSPLLGVADHAWFAVRTAWQTREDIEALPGGEGERVTLKFGIGVNTGEALAGNVGASNRMEYTLMGDTVNVAKRLQENAGPGEILIGEATHRLVADRVEVGPPTVIHVKGRQAPERVYPLTALIA